MHDHTPGDKKAAGELLGIPGTDAHAPYYGPGMACRAQEYTES